MKLGFDAKRFYNNATGLGNYSRNLISALDHEGLRSDITLFTPNVKREFEQLHASNSDRTVMPPRNKKLWRQFGIARDIRSSGVEIFHGLSAELPITPLGSVRSVVTIHDLLFRRFAAYYGYFDRMIYDRKTRSATSKADKVIAISDATKQDLVRYYNIDETKIEVIPVICETFKDHVALTKGEEQMISSLPSEFILCVSRFEKRKNHINLLRAYRDQAGQLPPLVLVGPEGDQLSEVREYIVSHDLESDVQMIISPGNSALQQLYAKCSAFVFPSLYEGFGMPVMEAMQHGKVVFTSENTSMSEITGSCGVLFDPKEPESIAESLVKYNDTELIKRIKESISGRLTKFSTSAIVSQHLELYRSLL